MNENLFFRLHSAALLEHGREVLPGVARFTLANFLRRALADERAAAAAALGAEVDHVIAGLDDVEVVLDNQHGVAAVGELAQHAHQTLAVGDVQAGRRLVEHIERPAGRCAG